MKVTFDGGATWHETPDPPWPGWNAGDVLTSAAGRHVITRKETDRVWLDLIEEWPADVLLRLDAVARSIDPHRHNGGTHD